MTQGTANKPVDTSSPRIVIRAAGFAAECRRLGLDTDAAIARQLGIAQSSVMRVTSGGSEPGARFIAAALVAFGPEKFSEVFRVTS